MDAKSIKEVFNELFSHLERLETQNDAILQFLQEKKGATEKQLAPYLEQAGNAANVKWRAARVRIERLLSDEEEGDKKIEKKPEIAQAESEKKQASEQKKVDAPSQANSQSAANSENKTDSQKKEQPAHEQVASPELEAAVQSKPAQQKKADEKDQASDRQPVAASNRQKPANDQPTQAPGKENNHPTEMTEPLAQSHGAEPPAELSPEKKSGDKEAA
jgi:hypothetical protein